jgi:radical SAM family uncharacterized protein
MHTLQEKIVAVLPLVEKPARYIGSEVNVVQKTLGDVDIRMVLSYPDIYEIGMSNLGLRILYESVNRIKNFYCERVFAPWPDFENKLREMDIPIYSLETFTPLAEFDVVGFSIGYELLCTNVLNILELARLQLRTSERGEKDPLIIAGGPGILNPEPMADFIDVFLFGEGECIVVDFLQMLLSIRNESRQEQLERLNGFECAYVPSLYKTKNYQGFCITDIDKVVKRRIEPDLEALPFPQKPLVPLMKIVQDRVNVEVNRGCLAGCRFCQAGFTYRPLRERGVKCILSIIRDSLDNTGYDEVSLVSLSIGDYSELHTLVRCIDYYFSDRKVSVSLPSLRVNSMNLDVLEIVQKVRKSGLTFAIESADERVRRVLNKQVDLDQLTEILQSVERMGWRLIKLYFMIGLPLAENEAQSIVAFVRHIKRSVSHLSFNVNVSVFVPKPFTPFEKCTQMEEEKAVELIEFLKRQFVHSKVHIKFQNPKMSTIEGILSRGDRSLGKLISEVYYQGERFSSWDEFFDYGRWERGMSKHGVKKEFYLNSNGATDRTPWYFIDSGIDKRFLREEHEKSKVEELTVNCVKGVCSQCGVCRDQIKNVEAMASEKYNQSCFTKKKEKGTGKYEKCVQLRYKMLFRFKKGGLYRFISHLDLLNACVRAGMSAGVPFAYSQGFNPKPRLILPFPLPLGVESFYEIGEVYLNDRVGEKKFIELYNGRLPRELEILNCKLSSEKKSVASQRFYHDYTVKPSCRSLLSVISRFKTLHKRNIFDEHPSQFYVVKEDSVFVRLEGRNSIKNLLNGERAFPSDLQIRRIMIWSLKEGRLLPFID